MIESPPEESVQDKLLIFVSSRLAECREERKIVRDAIISINHQPVLFEHLGARAYSARTLYLSRLRSSQVMVAIYRSGYGYIDAANGMTISGLEDEYRFSQRHGIDVLCYVRRSLADRDARLARIIEEMQQGQVLWYYDDPAELEARVRDDLTAHITNRVLRAGATRDVLQETSANYLQRTEHRVGTLAPRTETLHRLEQAVRATQVLCIYGPSGIGKTTLAAQLAERISATYVRVTGLAPRDIFSVCATALNQPTQQAPQTYSTLEGARLGLAASWAEAKSTTLIVDECEFSDELISALSLADNESADRHVVITARTVLSGTTPFEVPPFARAEAERLVIQSRVTIDDAVLDSGSPLAIRTAILNAEGALATAERISQLTGVAGELLRYLALSDVPLSSDQLLRLRADRNYSIEQLYSDLQSFGSIIDDSPRGLRLMHADTAAAVVSELQATPQRLSFYVQRLIRLFEDAGDLLLVYRSASLLNDGTEARYAPATAWQAARLGDWRTAVRITDQLLNVALGDERRAEAFQLMLSLVYPLELMGEASTAATLMGRAETLAQALGEEAQRELEETKICSRARRGLST